MLIIKVFDWEVSQKTSICKSMTSQINFLTCIGVMNVIFTPLWLPFLGFESDWKRTSHLYSLAYWQIRSCFMIEKPKYLIIKINRSASKFDLIDIIILFQSQGFNFVNEILCLKQFLSTSRIFWKSPFSQQMFYLLESFLLLWMSFLICG